MTLQWQLGRTAVWQKKECIVLPLEGLSRLHVEQHRTRTGRAATEVPRDTPHEVQRKPRRRQNHYKGSMSRSRNARHGEEGMPRTGRSKKAGAACASAAVPAIQSSARTYHC